MAYLKRIVLTFLTLLSLTVPAAAQSDDPLVFATVHRPSFADTPEVRRVQHRSDARNRRGIRLA